MNFSKGVILAGGMGTRARTRVGGKKTVKVMFPINNKPILERKIELLRDQLDIRSILVVVGYGAELIKEHFGDGKKYGVKIEYLTSDPHLGIADALYLAKDKVGDLFVVLLGDEFYLNSNHAIIKELDSCEGEGIVTFTRTDNPQDISNNYSVQLADGMRVTSLVEKPEKIEGDILGLGTFVLKQSIFDYIEKTEFCSQTKRKELVESISNMAKEKEVYAQELGGKYVNINTRDDWRYAQYLVNQAHFSELRKSLVIPSYNEVSSISFVINDFKNVVDEIVVADGGSTDGTAEILKDFEKTGTIKLVQKKFRGYGDALRHAIDASTGDIIVMVEGDATFRSRDVFKMYEYIKDCDLVMGTRTTSQLICQGANMMPWLRMGNIFAAKIIGLLWFKHEPRFSDVGCSYRTFWKSSYDEIKHNFIGIGPEFSPEMMIEFIKNNMRVIEIPVSYYKRVGGMSKHSQSHWGILNSAMRMSWLTIKKLFS